MRSHDGSLDQMEEFPMRHRFSCLVSCAVLLAAAIPAAAQPITVNPGDDGWVTPSGGTSVNLAAYPTTSVFGSAVTFSPSLVSLVGSPIDSTNLGSTDTIVERYNSVFLPSIGSTGTTTLEIQALRLVGNTAASNGKTYQVKVCLSEWHSGSLGTMNLKLTAPNGGSFTSSFPVLPKLIFTNVANPADVGEDQLREDREARREAAAVRRRQLEIHRSEAAGVPLGQADFDLIGLAVARRRVADEAQGLDLERRGAGRADRRQKDRVVTLHDRVRRAQVGAVDRAADQ